MKMYKIIEKLQYITHTISNASHGELARQACLGGVKWVQLRMKDTPGDIIAETAAEVLQTCSEFGAKLIINDHPEIAKEVGANGVHLGKKDMPPEEARKILGDHFIIGGTANTFEDIQRLSRAGVDYIGLGPYRFTDTKKKLSPILGIDGYTDIFNKCREKSIHIPIIAIGGIVAEDIAGIMNTGVYGIAVSSAITAAEDRNEAAKILLNKINDK